MIEFDIFRPVLHLTKYINTYTFAKGMIESKTVRPLPNGSLDMIFYFTDMPDFKDLSNNSTIKLKNFVGGQLSNPEVLINVDKNPLDFLSVSFTYFGFYEIFGIPQIAFRNSFLPLETIGRKDIKELIEKLHLSKSNAERVLYLDDFFSRKIFHRIPKIHPSVRESVYEICKCYGRIRVRELIKVSNMSERALERNFKYIIGLTCKEFIDTIRFKNIYANLSSIGQGKGWYDLVEEFGYYDQSHFIKDLKRFTGLTPHELCRNHDKYILSNRVYLSQGI